MGIAELASKTQIPLPPFCGVERERLTDMLNQRVPHYGVVLLYAPAGYGKTTLLSQWARATQMPIAWLTLSAEDNRVVRFLRLLVSAWIDVRPEIRDSSLSLVLGSVSPDIDAALHAFVEASGDSTGDIVFVLDDYHLIDEAEIHEVLNYLIDRLPPTFHFIVAGRTEPPLSLAIFRARDQVWELLTEDLKFSLQETAQFVEDMIDIQLTEDQSAVLQERLEGWPAGVRLVALSLQRDLTSLDGIVVGGRHRFIADYLTTDVLDRLSPEVQEFLLKTSVVDRLCGSLCDALTDGEHGQEMLNTLEREGLFLIALDDQRDWYRYHQLFSDFLRETLHERFAGEIADLHQRAAYWYVEHGLAYPAMRHAIEAGNGELVDDIIGRTFPFMLHTGQVTGLESWLASIPHEWHRTYPSIAIARAGVYLYSGQMEQAAAWLDELEYQFDAEGKKSDIRQAGISAMRCFVACFQNDLAHAEVLADLALQEISEAYIDMRAGVYGALGDTYRRNGQWRKARESYLELLSFSTAPTFRVEAVHVFGALADLALRQGQLHVSAGYWRRALDTIRTHDHWDDYSLPLSGWVYIRMAEILYEWNELAEGWNHLTEGLERAELGGDPRTLISGYLAASRLKLSMGDLEEAKHFLGRGQALVVNTQFSEWIDQFERLQLQVWLAQDQLRQAMDWIQSANKDNEPEDRAVGEFAQLGMAQVLIAEGSSDSVQHAHRVLDQLLRQAQSDGRGSVVVEVYALLALAYTHEGESSQGLIALGKALRLAEPEGYVRSFVDLGLPMARLLQEAQSRGVTAGYAARLLAAYDLDRTSIGVGDSLPEPLTPRELDVLELMSAGLTNREIADQLVIAPGTVKKHTGNIYGKLDVSNRTEAVARARALDLLQ